MEELVWGPEVRIAPVKNIPTKRQRSLPLESGIQYGLMEKGYIATEMAKEIAASTEELGYEIFAKHILLNCGGLRVVEAIQQMALDQTTTKTKIKADSLARYLSAQDFFVAEHNTAINSLRMWLEKVGIFNVKGWEVNMQRKAELLGLDDTQIASLVNLPQDSQAFALALCRLAPHGKVLASDVRNNAETVDGARLGRESLPKIMEPLRSAGFIDFESGGTSSGKSARVWTTDKFDASLLEEFLRHTVKDLDAVLTDYYTRDFRNVIEDLKSPNKNVKGQALEAFVVQVMRLLGLNFIGWRVRSSQTGGAEVDAVLSGVLGGVPTRWQVQCKNTSAKVASSEVAREMGLVPLSKATHVLMVATSEFSREAVSFADEVMKNSAATIFLVGGKDFQSIADTYGSALSGILRSQSERIIKLHRFGLETEIPI